MFKRKKKRIFLDYASTTPLDKSVKKAMEPFLSKDFHNPSAIYKEGVEVERVLDRARQDVARTLHVTPEEITFTGSGTESINLSLLGAVAASRVEKPHVITTAVEHAAVLEVCKKIEEQGGEVTYLSVDEEGRVSPGDVKQALQDNTVIVSIGFANNEIGTIQPIAAIAREVKKFRNQEKRAPFIHTDASQAPLYIDCSLEKLGVDMLTLDGLKMYGPKGIGILAHKRYVPLEPMVFGGGQERGLRSGTENTPAIVGFATALELAVKLREKESNRLVKLRDQCIEKILEMVPQARLNGAEGESRLPNNINMCFPEIDAEFAVIQLDKFGIACSYASSCKTLSDGETSHVIDALGGSCGASSLRFTMGRGTTQKDIDYLLKKLPRVIS